MTFLQRLHGLPIAACCRCSRVIIFARTGLVGPGNATPQNTWRNNLNLQKGVGCYAPVADLSSITFLNENRVDCKYLQPQSPGTLAGGRCLLCVSGAYRNESHRKWLRIDPGGSGYATTDMQNTANITPYVAPSGARIPLVPLIIALYFDADPGLAIGNRTSVSFADFAADFNFSQQEIAAYFDTSATHPLNAALYEAVGASAAASSTQPGSSHAPTRLPPGASSGPAQPLLGGTPAQPPNVNNGWMRSNT